VDDGTIAPLGEWYGRRKCPPSSTVSSWVWTAMSTKKPPPCADGAGPRKGKVSRPPRTPKTDVGRIAASARHGERDGHGTARTEGGSAVQPPSSVPRLLRSPRSGGYAAIAQETAHAGARKEAAGPRSEQSVTGDHSYIDIIPYQNGQQMMVDGVPTGVRMELKLGFASTIWMIRAG
jgi:hypothetical protein